MSRKFFFALQYWLKNPPWDTGVTPPEVYAFLEDNSPGRALDLGCGTGTNALTLASSGWQVTGIDFVTRAIRTARRKIRRAGYSDRVSFLVGDVLTSNNIEGEYDLILDIGCFHSFSGIDVQRYQEIISSRLVSGGSLLLYVHLNENPGPGHGTKESDLSYLERDLSLVSRQDGDEFSRPSAWLRYQKD